MTNTLKHPVQPKRWLAASLLISASFLVSGCSDAAQPAPSPASSPSITEDVDEDAYLDGPMDPHSEQENTEGLPSEDTHEHSHDDGHDHSHDELPQDTNKVVDGIAEYKGWVLVSQDVKIENINGVEYTSIQAVIRNDTGEEGHETSFSIVGKDAAGEYVAFHSFASDVGNGESTTVPFMGAGIFDTFHSFDAIPLEGHDHDH